MALLNLGDDPWLLEHESCERLQRDIMAQLMERQKLARTTEKHSHLSANIRLRLKQYNNEVEQLQQKLDITAQSGSITPAESERRARQVELLQSKSVQLEKLFNEPLTNKLSHDREILLGDASGSNLQEQTYSVNEFKKDQSRMLEEQEEGLETLSQIISRQKNIAHTISDEVDLHNEILDDLGNRVDRTDTRVRTETDHISVVQRKDKTCVYWVLIVLLFISIIAVVSI